MRRRPDGAQGPFIMQKRTQASSEPRETDASVPATPLLLLLLPSAPLSSLAPPQPPLRHRHLPMRGQRKEDARRGEKIESPQRAPGLLPATRPARVPRLANHTSAQGPPGLPSALAVASRSFGSVRLPPPAAGPPRICWVGTYAARFPTTDLMAEDIRRPGEGGTDWTCMFSPAQPRAKSHE